MSTTRREAFVFLRVGLVVGLIPLGLTNPAGAHGTKNALESAGDVTRSWSSALRAGERVVQPAPLSHEAILHLFHVSPSDDPHSGRQAWRRK